MSAPTGIDVSLRWGLEFGTFRQDADGEPYPYAVFRGFFQKVYEWDSLVDTITLAGVGEEGSLGDLSTPIAPSVPGAIYGDITYIVENIDYTYDYNSRANVDVATVEYRLSAEYAAVWEDGQWKRGPKMSKGGDPDWQEWLDEQD